MGSVAPRSMRCAAFSLLVLFLAGTAMAARYDSTLPSPTYPPQDRQGDGERGDNPPVDDSKEPKKAQCNNPKYKDCHNTEHVCPKFCPGGYCEVDCRSCRPVCSYAQYPPPNEPKSPPPTLVTPPPTAESPPPKVEAPPPKENETPPPPPPPPQSPPPKAEAPATPPQTPPPVVQAPPPKAEAPPREAPSPAPVAEAPPPVQDQTPPPVDQTPPPKAEAPATPPQTPPPVVQAPPPKAEAPPTEAPTSPPVAEAPPPAQDQTPPPEAQTPPPKAEAPPTEAPTPPPVAEVPPTESPTSPPVTEVPPTQSPSPPPKAEAPPPKSEAPPVQNQSPPPVSEAPPPKAEAPPTPVPSPPPNAKGLPKTAKCTNPLYNDCYDIEQVCPKSCPGGNCEIDCRSCKPVCSCDKPGAVCQDPRFIGGDGITFYFHGKKDRDFCLLSDSNLHINARFIGKRNPDMKRDFTWVQSIGILFNNHQIFVGARRTATWDDMVDRLSLSFDGEPVFLPTREGSRWESSAAASTSITRSRDTNGVTVEVASNFRIEAKVVPITKEESRVHSYGITEEDCMAHLELAFKFYSLSDSVHGVLGQTYRKGYVSRVRMGIDMPVLGGEREFSASSLFSPDCSVARFVGSSSMAESSGATFASLNCRSGMNGPGIVCKR